MNHFQILCQRNPHHAVVDPHGRLARCNKRTMTKPEWQAHRRDWRQLIKEWHRFENRKGSLEKDILCKQWAGRGREFKHCELRPFYSKTFNNIGKRNRWRRRMEFTLDHSRIIHPKPERNQ